MRYNAQNGEDYTNPVLNFPSVSEHISIVYFKKHQGMFCKSRFTKEVEEYTLASHNIEFATKNVSNFYQGR